MPFNVSPKRIRGELKGRGSRSASRPFLSFTTLNISILVKATAVKTDDINPSAMVMAKPLIGPLPNINSKLTAMSVVKLESTMVAKAFSKPTLIALSAGRPFRLSSLIRSLMRILASTAMPMVNIRPAMPGKVSVAPNSVNAPNTRAILIHSAKLAIAPHLP